MVKFAVAFLLTLGLSLPAFAAGSKLVVPAPHIAKLSPVKVDPAVLEFIGTWQTSDGQLVDPMMFASINLVQLQALPEQLREKPRAPAGAAGSVPDKTSAREVGSHP